ncbi:hypothetical protein [Flavobacterium frigoris]|uniref:Uncharacterized protein n=1 Tax=Flavobacterium frigoris TaxID=229204 RepID=A0A1H9GDT0_FLAFI|nr:hypothetical protein [Flavobacterium frigoris]SEQ48183.1 hypothetical protein SAMN05444355_102467 [Flavobacterium frigoris]
MITITPDEILFYELYRHSKRWELFKTEKIAFSENPDSYSFTEFLYSNNEIWEYTINKDSGELTTFYIGEKIEDNYTQLVCGNPLFYYFKLHKYLIKKYTTHWARLSLMKPTNTIKPIHFSPNLPLFGRVHKKTQSFQIGFSNKLSKSIMLQLQME